ncbi:glycosyltransferase [Bacteroidales bacterium OttesenSCG-928-L19]|nr:glycosyltransferase [Bacteroidales bacterium OttesenSCG-928-L19]
MLSILIPVYNWNVTTLIKELHDQLTSSGLDFEVIIMDDASDDEFVAINRELENLSHTFYFRNDVNQGRSRVRNELANKAQYPYLLFMDSDAALPSEHFVQNYIDVIKENKEIEPIAVLGGVAYRNEKSDKKYSLRKKFGKKREEIPAAIRNKKPYRSFTPFNLLISKSIFDTVIFNEVFTTYGNEDTLFGLHLRDNQIKVLHIDNPLYHDGLDENEVYMLKIETSVENLLRLVRQDMITESFIKDYKLLDVYFKLKRRKLLPLVDFVYSFSGNALRRYLLKHPNLFLLDFHKLGYFSKGMKNEKCRF